ncbi:MAG TPA: hypothetical protein VHV08_15090 [Pirellulales bacterium]|jgi:hypothetical protein|nr:hypothetical protein [Pirellulales bacterium]
MDSKSRLSQASSHLQELVAEAIDHLDASLREGSDSIEEDLGIAQVLTIRLRDRLIERARKSRGEGAAAMRRLLNETNVALSLIAGVEYPIKGFRQKLIEQARAVLWEVQKLI